MSAKPQRVLFIASQPFFEWRGSPIRLGFDLQALVELGYAVDFLTLPLGQRRELAGVRILRAPNLFFARRIAIGPSLMKLAFDGLLLIMAVGQVLRRRYAVVHGVEDAGMVAWVAARLGRAGLVFEKHSDPSSYRRGPLRNAVMASYAAVERFLMRRADAVIGTGPGLVRQARAVGRGGRACHIPDIPSSRVAATPGAAAAARARLAPGTEAVLIAYVGSFAAYQGIDLLFEAIPRVVLTEPRARFAVIGGSPREIAQRREALGAKGAAGHVTFVGHVAPDQLPSVLASADILLSPRLGGVNTPLKLLDYLKAGAAIVATDCEANRLLLDERVALLTPLTVDGFADGILTLCRDGARRLALAQAARERLLGQHTYEHFREGLRNCYDYVLATKST